MVEPQPSKLTTGVRFSSSAPYVILVELEIVRFFLLNIKVLNLINDYTFLFFNGVNTFYVNNLNEQHNLSELEKFFKLAKSC